VPNTGFRDNYVLARLRDGVVLPELRDGVVLHSPKLLASGMDDFPESIKQHPLNTYT
jgi:hypothetical protein